MFSLLVKLYLTVLFEEILYSFNHKHDWHGLNFWNSQIKFSNECLLKKVGSRLTRSCKLSYINRKEVLFSFFFCTFGSCWAICNTDTCLHMRSKRLMISLLVSKIYWIILIVCKTIKNSKHFCKQQLVNIILVINWLVIAPISLYIFVNTNTVWGLFLVKEKYLSFVLNVMPY